jgi:hypothetical protein
VRCFHEARNLKHRSEKVGSPSFPQRGAQRIVCILANMLFNKQSFFFVSAMVAERSFE